MLSGIFVQRSQLIRHHEQTTSLYIVPQEVLVNTLLISFTKPHPHNWENAGVKSEFGEKKVWRFSCCGQSFHSSLAEVKCDCHTVFSAYVLCFMLRILNTKKYLCPMYFGVTAGPKFAEKAVRVTALSRCVLYWFRLAFDFSELACSLSLFVLLPAFSLSFPLPPLSSCFFFLHSFFLFFSHSPLFSSIISFQMYSHLRLFSLFTQWHNDMDTVWNICWGRILFSSF